MFRLLSLNSSMGFWHLAARTHRHAGGPGGGRRRGRGGTGAMATVVPTAAQVRKQAFGRPKIVEALQLLGVDAHHKTGAKALKAQLLQLIEGGRRRRRRRRRWHARGQRGGASGARGWRGEPARPSGTPGR